MSVSNDDSKLVEIIKKIESNCFDFYKLYESGLLFILGIILTGSTASFIEIFRDNKIPLKTEPPRDCRRLNILREYDNEKTNLHS